MASKLLRHGPRAGSARQGRSPTQGGRGGAPRKLAHPWPFLAPYST